MAFLGLNSSDRIAVIAVGASLFSVFFGVYQYRQQTTESLERQRMDSIRFNQQISDQRAQFDAQMQKAEEHFSKQFELTKKSDSAQLKLTELSIKNFVRPVLVIRRYTGTEDNEMGIIVQNSGIGPAIITSVELYYDKKRLLSAAEITPLVIKDRLDFFLQDDPPSFSDIQRYDVIQKGEEYKVYYMSASKMLSYKDSRANLEIVIHKKIRIVVHYSSLTEDWFVVSD